MTEYRELQVYPNYTPRDYQAEFEHAMHDGKTRALLVWHRRCGKDIACLNFMVDQMMRKVGVYYYLFPTHKQARKVIWDGIQEDGKRIIDVAFPKDLIDGKPNQTEMKIRLHNGSLFQLIGSDIADSIAGTNPCGVVLSEYSLQDPTCWNVILRPILRKNKGWAVFNGTPRGKNHQYDLDVMARANPDEWFYQRLTVDTTNLIPPEDIEKERREGVSEEVIQQEYYCSYERGIEGSYYGRLIDKARREGRIGRVYYEPRAVVNCYYDIGFGDSTAIIFAQDVGTELRVIDFYEASGESFAHYVKVLQAKPYVYGKHYFPHDAGSGSLQTGTTLQKVASDLGIKSIILPRDDIEVGIEMTRTMLNTAYIDEFNCSHLLKCLENYHKKFNEKMNCYSNTPVHDWSSHAADACRYMAMARAIHGKGSDSLTPEKINEMRHRNLGW
jgi:hypothetical protein